MLASERAGSGPRVVLVHGFTLTRDCWGSLADDLATDHEVVRVDAPGHGGSSDVRADLAETAELLADFGPAIFVGYSMGGRMCVELALRHPASVTALVLVSASAGIDSHDDRRRRRAADEAMADWIEADGVDHFIDHWLGLPLFAGLPVDGRYEQQRRANTAAGLASSLRLAGSGTQSPSWDRLGALTMPVLVVVGAEDAKFEALGRRLADCIGANATLAVIAGAGHTTHLEAPEAVIDAVRDWL